MEISLAFQEHPDDDIWEKYALGRVGPQQEATLEEHFLACERCQHVLAKQDEYVRAMKFAAAHFGDRAIRPKTFRLIPALRAHLPQAGFASLVATAGLILLLWTGPGILRNGRPAAANSVMVPLKSLRSVSDVLNHGPAGHPLDLSVSLVDVPVAARYRIEVVTATGKPVWSELVPPAAGTISAHLGKSLPAGAYWVRLYAPPSELLVEYGLKLD